MYVLLLIVAISLIWGIWLVLGWMRIVPVRQALIVFNRLTGTICRVAVGPKIAYVLPWENMQPLDLTMQIVHLDASNVITTDLAVATSLDIFYAIDPSLLHLSRLNEILPGLVTRVEEGVKSTANYILRSLIAGHTTTELLTIPGRRAHLERLLQKTLQDRVKPLGVRIHTARLLCHPAPMMLEAKLRATRTQLTAQARARALEMLTTALGPDRDITSLSLLELFEKVRPDNGTTAFNLLLPVAPTVNGQKSFALPWLLASHQ